MSVSRVPVLRLQHAQATVSWRNIVRLAIDGLENISSSNEVITYRGRAILGHLHLMVGKIHLDTLGQKQDKQFSRVHRAYGTELELTRLSILYGRRCDGFRISLTTIANLNPWLGPENGRQTTSPSVRLEDLGDVDAKIWQLGQSRKPLFRQHRSLPWSRQDGIDKEKYSSAYQQAKVAQSVPLFERGNQALPAIRSDVRKEADQKKKRQTWGGCGLDQKLKMSEIWSCAGDSEELESETGGGVQEDGTYRTHDSCCTRKRVVKSKSRGAQKRNAPLRGTQRLSAGKTTRTTIGAGHLESSLVKFVQERGLGKAHWEAAWCNHWQVRAISTCHVMILGGATKPTPPSGHQRTSAVETKQRTAALEDSIGKIGIDTQNRSF
ncbi:hypothetical protein BC827DRAFT_1157489 [Russula dissimulans]|nr:hypothetical protein BC827DRAFT_1157489 [Russula dissimulans]